jgi:adenosine deaminase
VSAAAAEREVTVHKDLLTGLRPKSVDLHTHLRGTFPPDLARRLSEKNGVAIPGGVIGSDGSYVWTDFTDFLSVYDRIGSLVAGPDDLCLIAQQYLVACAAEGSIYVELMLSPAHSIRNGIAYAEQIEGVAAGIQAAREATGIEAGLVVTCVRHRGPEEALRIAELAAQHPHEAVVGFGMTGDERRFTPDEFGPAFRLAADSGLKRTAHAGEWLDARSVLHTVEVLDLDRIGHGIRAAEDSGVLAELAARELGFEVCLSSNVRLGVVASIERHPLPAMLEAGCRVSLATDDPAYFDTTPSKEYRIAATLLGIDYSELARITHNAIMTGFCKAEVKASLRASLGELDRPTAPVRRMRDGDPLHSARDFKSVAR